MRIPTIAAISALLALVLAASADATDVYRWTDEKGVVHYSDTPPAGSGYERMNVRSGTATAAAPAPATDVAKDSATAPKPAALDPAERAERCQTAQRNLIALRSELEVTAEFDGQTRALTPQERQEQISQNEKQAERYCDTH